MYQCRPAIESRYQHAVPLSGQIMVLFYPFLSRFSPNLNKSEWQPCIRGIRCIRCIVSVYWPKFEHSWLHRCVAVSTENEHKYK